MMRFEMTPALRGDHDSCRIGPDGIDSGGALRTLVEPELVMRVEETTERKNWEVSGSEVPVAGPAAVREQTQRVLSDPLFHHSKRYSDLLKYIVDRTLDGQNECLKERIIGIEVFDRSPDYDTTVDSIVRGAAAEVRKRLARYYQETSHSNELRIQLPTRSYVAEFELPALKAGMTSHGSPNEPIAPSPSGFEPKMVLTEPSIPRLQLRPIHYVVIAIIIALLSLGARAARRAFIPVPIINSFWGPLLNNPGKILISIGSPSPDMRPSQAQELSQTLIKPGTPLSDVIGSQVSFPLSEMNAGSDMTAFLTRHGKDSGISLSQSTALSDLRRKPLVVIGSYPNQWAVRLGEGLPFQFRSDGSVHWIQDVSHPADKNWIVDMHAPFELVTSEYSLITRGFNQSTEQWWIGVGGLTVLGTLAAEQMVIDPRTMETFGRQFPKDWEHRNLQIVVQTNMLNGSLGTSKVIALRTW